MAHADYPGSPPIECVTDAISIIRNDETAERRDELFYCAWNIQGYLFSTFIGNPEKGKAFKAESPEIQEEFFVQCKALIQCVHDDGSECCAQTIYGNDIIEMLEEWGLEKMKDLIAPLLRFIYNLIGREWGH